MKHGEEYVSTGRHRITLKASAVLEDRPYKPQKTIDEANLETCLNCDNPNCKGNCDKIKRRKSND